MIRLVADIEQNIPSAPELTAKFFRGLGDATRIRILHVLLDGDKNVTQLVEFLNLPQGRVSSHLACLRWCGYVRSYRDGKNVYYAVADPKVEDLLRLAGQVLTETAERVLACDVIK